MPPLFTTADDRTAGVACHACSIPLRQGEPVALCGACAAPHHRACWEHDAACSSYECAPANRRHGSIPPPSATFVITADQINAAAPLPTRPAYVPPVYTGPASGRAAIDRLGPDGRPKISRNAVAAVICAVAGIPFFGLVTGAVAIVLGALSLGPITGRKRRGVWLATIGILLGLVDVVGWAVFIGVYYRARSMPGLHTPDFHVSESSLKDSPPVVAASLRANVLISRGVGMGSGVVISVRDGEALILTNRHVASPDSTTEGAEVSVQYVDGQTERGRVVWNGPEGIDASLVRAPAGRAAAVASADPAVTPHIGDDVFAVGNPFGLGWTHTKGAISQFRERNAGSAITVRIIQTSAPINPGNSGGGLYTAAGQLIGINTYSGDKRESEGLGFAIALDSIRTVLPQWAIDDLKAAQTAPPAAGEKGKPAP